MTRLVVIWLKSGKLAEDRGALEEVIVVEFSWDSG